MKNILYVIVIFLLFLIGLFFWKGRGAGPDPYIPPPYLNSTTYTIEGSPVTLHYGVSDVPTAPGSASHIVTKYFGNEVESDLNHDRLPDVAFILTQTSGGSGTFYYVVVALQTATGYVGTNAVLLGDRIAPQSTEIKDGTIIVNYADRKPDEPMTAQPSIGKSKYLVLQNGSLVETPIFIQSISSVGVDHIVTSPLSVTGVAKGNWFFEASFPVNLLDQTGKVIAQAPAHAQGNWMTTDYVPFTVTLTFPKQQSGTHGTLVLKKDNPSGLLEHDDSQKITVTF